ncbi:CoF synthetase [Zhouia spongiae]|uniref:CoF synthetase n=1 Tax=Zhouia spongiae TaxID=2202721 RepID=A0ABY3YIC8_9FLAO|nr:CoF synthetase [Zhouia spongiae]UNY97445.1 CoF synthetase [Zhouia spongiae]
MRVESIIRNRIFWGLDSLKGNLIKKHLNDIRLILEDINSNGSMVRRSQLLKQVMKHAATTTPFYFRYKNHSGLRDFPVIKKSEVINLFDDFKSRLFLNSRNYKVSTSGSTGIPFTIYHNKEKKYRNTAETIYFLEKNGYKVGERLYYLRMWSGETKSFFKTLTQNIVKIDVYKLTDENIASILNTIKKDPSFKSFIGIASSFETICHYLKDANAPKMNINANFFIGNSDGLSPFTKKSIKKYFNAPIVSRYSNEEQGIIAQQEINSDDIFKINWASYFVEILNFHDDAPAKEGETGRIVVTDLFNYAMPLIRYDTGDLGCYKILNGEMVLTKVEGRKMDAVYTTSGELLSPYAIYPRMQDYFDYFNQYQFIQTGVKEYLIKLNYKKDFLKETEFKEHFKDLLGSDAKITVEYVNEIPVLLSGKRKRVMNLYHPKTSG